MPMNEYGEIIRNSTSRSSLQPDNGGGGSKHKGIIIISIIIILVVFSFGTGWNNRKTEEPVVEQKTQQLEGSDGDKEPSKENQAVYDKQYEWVFSESLYEKSYNISNVYGDVKIVNNGEDPSGAEFDGDGDYIECGKDINLSEKWSFHTFLSCKDIDKEYSAFFAKYETNYQGPYAFSICHGRINCWFTERNGGYKEIWSNYQLENDEWVDVIITKDGTHLTLYINGNVDNREDVDCVLDSEDTVTIGRQALMFEPYEQLQFTGCIAEIEIYEKLLTEEEIVQLSRRIPREIASQHVPFWGVWCYASRDEAEAHKVADELISIGLEGRVFLSSEWSNLNQENWYCTSASIYSTESEAERVLSVVQDAGYADAYIKYSGSYIG